MFTEPRTLYDVYSLSDDDTYSYDMRIFVWDGKNKASFVDSFTRDEVEMMKAYLEDREADKGESTDFFNYTYQNGSNFDVVYDYLRRVVVECFMCGQLEKGFYYAKQLENLTATD